MVVQNLIPTPYRRIKGRHTYHQPYSFNYVKSLSLTSVKLLLDASKKADVITFGNVFSIYQFSNSQIDAIRNNYHLVHPTSARLKSPNIKQSIPSVVKKRIQELERLSVGWDSYSARAINREAIEAAISLLIQISSDIGHQLAEFVFIAPCSDGGIQLEWELNSKELIIKIAPGGKQLFFLLVLPSEKEREGTISSKDDLNSLLHNILRS